MSKMLVVANSTKTLPVEVKKGGKTYLVADAVLINEGVLPGSNGPMLYLSEEMAKNPGDWDNIPIILDHAYDDEGNPISANSREVMDEQGLGFVSNTEADGKLKSKLWFEVPLLKKVGRGLYDKVKRGEKLELSTGLYSDEEMVQNGEHNGISYASIARNFRPDHLAILLDKRGACGLDDGCGVNVNKLVANAEDGVFKKFLKALYTMAGKGGHEEQPVLNELSHDALRQQLGEYLRSTRTQDQPHCYIYEVYDNYFVYEEMGGLWRQDYTLNSDDSPAFKGKPKMVRREISYVTNQESEDSMKLTKEQRQNKINFITANCSCWKRNGDKEILNNLPDEKLIDIEKDAVEEANKDKVAAAARAGFTQEQTNEIGKLIAEGIKATLQGEDGKMPWEKTTAAQAPVAPVATTVTANEWMASAPPEIRSAIQTSMGITQQHKDQLIGKIIGNERDESKRRAHYERLNLETVDKLSYIASLIPDAAPSNPWERSVPNFLGAGVTANSVNAQDAVDQDDILPMPSIYSKAE